MQVVVHVGMPKTGSSTLQNYFYACRARMRDDGITYPDYGHRAHWILAAAFGRAERENYLSRRLERDRSPVSPKAAVAQLHEEITRGGEGGIVLLSHEALCEPESATHLRDWLKAAAPKADIRFVAYARQPADHFPSVVQQSLKSDRDEFLAPTSWESGHCRHGAGLARELGSALTLRAFSHRTLRDGDVVDDFRDLFLRLTGRGLPDPGVVPRENTSYSAPACAILQLLTLAPGGAPDNARKQLRRRMLRLDAEARPPRLNLPEAWRDAIAATNGPGWNHLVGIMDYGPAERAALAWAGPDVPGGLTGQDSRGWVLSHYDQTYASRLLEDLRQASDGRPKARALAAWLSRALRRIEEGGIPPF